MKPKQIIIVIIAFAFLAILYIFQKSRQREVVEGLGYKKVIGEKLATADISEFKCYVTGREEEGVHLIRQDGDWVVRSKFDAPAKESQVDEFVEKLQNLEGELRSSSKDVLPDYGIDDDNAIHLVLLDTQGREKKHLLLGKQGPAWNQVFVRLDGSSDVYLAGEDLRRPFRIPSEQPVEQIDSTQWCELSLMKIVKEDVSRVELETPHRRLILELREKAEPTETSEAEETPELPDSDAEETPEMKSEAEPEKEWVMVEPKLNATPNESGINRLTSVFVDVVVSDVVARGELESYGLKEPSGTCTVTTQSGETHRFLIGKPLPDLLGAHYVRLDDGDLVYKMDRWKLDSIFIKMSHLIGISAPSFSKDDVASLTVEAGGRSFEFEKKDGSWHTRLPALDKEPKSEKIDKILDVVTNLRPQDMATLPAPEITRFDKPAAVVRFSGKDGKRHTVTFGGVVPLSVEDRFVRLDDRKDIWIITQGIWNRVNPKAAELFDLRLTGFEIDDVTSLTLHDAGGELKLALTEVESSPDAAGESAGPQWVVEGKKEPVDQETVRSILSILAGLAAEDLFDAVENAGLDKPVWSARLLLAGEKTFGLTVGNAAASSGYYARVDGDKTIFLVAADDVDRLMDLTRQLRE